MGENYGIVDILSQCVIILVRGVENEKDFYYSQTEVLEVLFLIHV
jgi:hypothetical protein